ncbi:MAG: MFS transporter [Gammaproteobacteria bacterium]|nr:MFS transporter [Gammaproteobacteria bacterium]MBT4493508.1 MFS transporter [Gammaproteobacteria bacterium]MBT7369724.1 MFS transporter [Gammaproteobacteria bacterium]
MNLKPYRTLIVLGAAQSFGQTAAPILVLLGGIVGAKIAPSLDWATLPLAIMIIGIASAAIPASMLMARFGRKAGFLAGSAISVAAALLAAWAVNSGSFYLFCLASFMIGNYAAFLQQFRFAVAESVPTLEVPKCLSMLMLAGIVAALLGPDIGRRFSVVEGLPDYVGSFLGMAVLMSISLLILIVFYRNSEISDDEKEESARPLTEILKQPMLILAIASAVVGFSVMSLVMTATPVSMHEMDHHSLDDTTWVVQSHILAMYTPSLFSGFLIAWIGVMRIIQSGFAIMVACVVVGWGQPQLMHYWGAMVLLGVGWNFLFLGGTTLLTQTYRSSERFKVQAVNDFLVFGLQAVGSLGAGVLLASFGWNGVMAFSLPWLVVLLPALYVVNRKQPGQVVA